MTLSPREAPKTIRALRVPSWPARWTVIIGSALALINYCVLAYLDVFKPELLDSEVDPDAPPL